jgi:hypothetical protein
MAIPFAILLEVSWRGENSMDDNEPLTKAEAIEIRELIEKHREVLEWAKIEMSSASKRKAMVARIVESTLGHLVWIVVVGIGIAIWQWLKLSIAS